METGFEIVSEGAKSKRPSDEPAPTQAPMRPREQRRNPSTDQLKVRRSMQRKMAAGDEHEKDMTCPQCLQHVTVVLQPEGPKFTYNCPNCGYHGTIDAPKEATRRTTPVTGTAQDRASLLAEAARADTLAERQRLVAAADEVERDLRTQATMNSEASLADAVVQDTLTPVRVHEMHTASTDWLGDAVPYSSADDAQREMVAQASLWFGRTAEFVKQDPEEFGEQARGMARRLAGQFGEHADVAERAFLDYTAHLQGHTAASGLPVAPSDSQQQQNNGTAGPASGYEGLPVEVTTSERAPQIEVLEQAGNGAPTQTSHGSPLGQTQSTRKEATMQCPTCAGQGRVAVRQAPVQQTTAASGLDQIDQVVDAFENPKPTPLPTDVMWPWEIGQNQQQQVQNETEQQIRERQSRQGTLQQQAQAAAQAVYQRVLAGQDASGWAGTGGGPTGVPGVQDGGNPPGNNLGMPDEVYGFGGTNQDQPLKPYGADEANDITNNPGMGYQPGQPTQYDMGGRQQQTQASVDPEIAKAQRFIEQRQALLAQQG